jgi:phage terminase small subunit
VSRRAALSPVQKRFVAEYLVDLNAKQAAIRGGFSPRGAAVSGYRLLRKGPVARAVAARQAELTARIGVTVERIVAELARIGFSDIRDVVQWRAVPSVSGAGDGETSARVINLIDVKSANELTRHAAAAIAELSLQPSGGFRLRLHDKRAALVELGRHLGMFANRGPRATRLTVEIVRFGQSDDSADRAHAQPE